jgi:hypothetical protein
LTVLNSWSNARFKTSLDTVGKREPNDVFGFAEKLHAALIGVVLQGYEFIGHVSSCSGFAPSGLVFQAEWSGNMSVDRGEPEAPARD